MKSTPDPDTLEKHRDTQVFGGRGRSGWNGSVAPRKVSRVKLLHTRGCSGVHPLIWPICAWCMRGTRMRKVFQEPRKSFIFESSVTPKKTKKNSKIWTQQYFRWQRKRAGEKGPESTLEKLCFWYPYILGTLQVRSKIGIWGAKTYWTLKSCRSFKGQHD